MTTLAGLHDTFRKAEPLLKELAGWTCDSETLRRLVHSVAADAASSRADRQALPDSFAAESGDHEVHIDAGKVNTTEGWRDVKVAVLAARERGPAATPGECGQRELPAPGVVSVVAGVESSGEFGERCGAEAERVGMKEPGRVTVSGDGAEWIWNLAGLVFALSGQVLDVWHALEHLAEAGRKAGLEGEGLREWLEGAKGKLVGDGYAGVVEALAGLPGGVDGGVLNYFAGHRERMNYAARLARGQVIGSGAVEGAIKQRVNLRVKRTGARWKASHVGPFVEMLAMSDTPEWSEYWNNQAA